MIFDERYIETEFPELDNAVAIRLQSNFDILRRNANGMNVAPSMLLRDLVSPTGGVEYTLAALRIEPHTALVDELLKQTLLGVLTDASPSTQFSIYLNDVLLKSQTPTKNVSDAIIEWCACLVFESDQFTPLFELKTGSVRTTEAFFTPVAYDHSIVNIIEFRVTFNSPVGNSRLKTLALVTKSTFGSLIR